jgi:hypothetical protein
MTINELLKTLAQALYNIESKRLVRNQGETSDDTGVYVPPLQAELELLKKSTGMGNVFDYQDISREDTQDYKTEEDPSELLADMESCAAEKEEPDELDDIRKMAGISTTKVSSLSVL